jgi:hypothetical protein
MSEHDSGKISYYLRERPQRMECVGIVINGSSELLHFLERAWRVRDD